jgi:hypothetical protein
VNVDVEPYALGDRTGETDLFLVEGSHDWCNSLQPPVVEERSCKVRVDVRRLDDVLAELREGAELSFLRGATGVLNGESRPAILAEVQDLRTEPWGYPAREIIKFLSEAAYRWFALSTKGSLEPVSTELAAL